MARSKATPLSVLARKQDKLNWSLFGFLENLLVFCPTKSRSVPAESGVHFSISSKIKNEGVCVLFKIDRQRDPLMPGDGVKPDYLALYASRDHCICTIIEMKGRDQKKLEHGIEQIKALRDRLRQEIGECLPGAWRGKIKYQGILLTPINADIPRVKLRKEADAGFTILPLQYHHKAELYRYVRVELPLTERYAHEKLPRGEGGEFNPIEELLVHGALPERIKDASDAEHKAAGIHIHYAHRSRRDGEYAALLADPSGAPISTPEHSLGFREKIQAELSRLALDSKALKYGIIPADARSLPHP